MQDRARAFIQVSDLQESFALPSASLVVLISSLTSDVTISLFLLYLQRAMVTLFSPDFDDDWLCICAQIMSFCAAGLWKHIVCCSQASALAGASDDIRRATELAYRAVSEFGLSSVVGPLAVSSMGGGDDGALMLKDSGESHTTFHSKTAYSKGTCSTVTDICAASVLFMCDPRLSTSTSHMGNCICTCVYACNMQPSVKCACACVHACVHVYIYTYICAITSAS